MNLLSHVSRVRVRVNKQLFNCASCINLLTSVSIMNKYYAFSNDHLM